ESGVFRGLFTSALYSRTLCPRHPLSDNPVQHLLLFGCEQRLAAVGVASSADVALGVRAFAAVFVPGVGFRKQLQINGPQVFHCVSPRFWAVARIIPPV